MSPVTSIERKYARGFVWAEKGFCSTPRLDVRI